MAGKSTLNRLELSRLEPTRYHKISYNPTAIKRLLVDFCLEGHERAPNEIILDLDATDDPVSGSQVARSRRIACRRHHEGIPCLPRQCHCRTRRHEVLRTATRGDHDSKQRAQQAKTHEVARTRLKTWVDLLSYGPPRHRVYAKQHDGRHCRKPHRDHPGGRANLACDGGDTALGHPRVFLYIEDRSVLCPYCSRVYVLIPGQPGQVKERPRQRTLNPGANRQVSPDQTLRLILIDGSGFIFRAYHALPPMTRPDGTPVNAVFGFSNMLAKLLREHVGTHIAVIFDAGRTTFRNRLYEDYKAHRPPPRTT